MTTYRTGNHWGVTIVREGQPAPGPGHWHEGGPCSDCERPDELVAVVVNGDQELAERICALLNGNAAAAASRWRCNTTERCFREDGHDGPHGFAGSPPAADAVVIPLAADSCTCTKVGPDPACPVHHGRRARGPKPPPVGPDCVCDGSGRTCPRHGAVI